MAVRILRNMAAGLPQMRGMGGRSNSGGATWCLLALRRNGLLDQQGEITEAGRALIEADPCPLCGNTETHTHGM